MLHPELITFKELCRLTDLYASGFLKAGISRGMLSIVLVIPGVNLFAVVFALLRIGALPVMIDPGMGPKAMAKALSTTGAQAFIGVPKAHLLRLIFPEALRSIKIFISTSCGFIAKGHSLNKFRNQAVGPISACVTLPSDEVAVFFTSGSTGPAKAVVYQKHMLQAQINYLTAHFHYLREDTDLCTFPLIGLLVICTGISVVLADMNMTRPSALLPSKLIRNITEYGCTTMFCSPMILRKLTLFNKTGDLHLPSLRMVVTAGAPVPPALLRDFAQILQREAIVRVPFGSTEALSVTDATYPELLAATENEENLPAGICVGTPLEDIRIKIIRISDEIIDDIKDAEEPPRGEPGEIVVYGPNVTQRYLNNDPANRISKIRDPEGLFLWHRTGDLGTWDEKGNLWYYGRKTQRVETRDGTYYTIPVEAVFNRHPLISRSALVGITLHGERKPVICIELKKGTRPSEKLKDELRALALINEITKKIDHFIFRRNFPVDPRHNAKIFREKLRVWAQQHPE